MEQSNPPKQATKITEIVAGVNLVEIPYEVRVPIFVNEEVKRALFIDTQVQIPVGFDKVVSALALDISEKVLQSILAKLDEKLASAIDSRLTEIKYPKLVEELKVTEVPVSVDKPVYVDVTVERPVYVDREIINPVTKDVEVVNAIIIDKPYLNAVVTDVNVTNAIVRDVEVERAVIREKTIDVVHKNCFDTKGNPLV